MKNILNSAQILTKEDISDIESLLLGKNGLLRIVPYLQIIENFSDNKIKNFMLKHGIYFIPTLESVKILKSYIGDKNAIEIGCGNGALGRALDIPITDSKLQEENSVKIFYEASGQPTIKYPDDVLKLEAQEAIRFFKPNIVIGSFITHKYTEKTKSGNLYGVQEELVICKANYIMIGNKDTHADKPILKVNHIEQYDPCLITRSSNQKNNRIFIWNKV